MLQNNLSSSKKKNLSSNKSKTSLHIDVETPNKSHFEFGTIVIKSNDKLSSQKTAASSSNAKNRNPSQIAQLRLTTNPPDSVKRFTVKKSIATCFDTAALQPSISTSNYHSNQAHDSEQNSRNKSSLGFGLKTAVNNVKAQ